MSEEAEAYVKRNKMYSAICALVFLGLIILLVNRLMYLGSVGNFITARYNFLTGILPAIIVAYFGVDSMFYFLYGRVRARNGKIRNALSAWMFAVVIPASVMIVPEIAIGLYRTTYAMLMFVPFFISLAFPVYLSIQNR